jgi:hypothetical protein
MTEIEKVRFKIEAAELQDGFKRRNPYYAYKAPMKPGKASKASTSEQAAPLHPGELQIESPALASHPRLAHDHRVQNEQLRDLNEVFLSSILLNVY